jgi:Na+/proline symporter
MIKRWLLILLLLFVAPKIWAQGCSVCTKVANGLDDKKAKGMNSGILYLAAFPLSIMLTLGFLYWKHQKNSDTQ